MSVSSANASRARTRMYWIAAALFINITAVGYIPPLLIGEPMDATLLIAPMGASALLMLLRPNSSYAGPWTVMVANTVAALVGLATPFVIPTPIFAAAVALAMTVAAMGILRTVHPPSAGIALLATSLGAQPTPAALAFLIDKVMLSSAVLIGVSIVLTRLSNGALLARTRRGNARKDCSAQ